MDRVDAIDTFRVLCLHTTTISRSKRLRENERSFDSIARPLQSQTTTNDERKGRFLSKRNLWARNQTVPAPSAKSCQKRKRRKSYTGFTNESRNGAEL